MRDRLRGPEVRVIPGPHRRHRVTRVLYLPSSRGGRRHSVIGMGRKLVIELPDGSRQFLEQVQAEQEVLLQEQLKLHPELLPRQPLLRELETPGTTLARTLPY